MLLLLLLTDGHGGKEAAAHSIEYLFEYFVEAAAGRSDPAACEASCKAAFSRAHEEVLRGKTTAGTAATMCVINESSGALTCASVGDAFAALLPEGMAAGGTAVIISANHRVQDNPDERARVRACGGKLGKVMGPNGQPGGPLRAWPGGLACARSIGDADCTQVVVPHPEIFTGCASDELPQTDKSCYELSRHTADAEPDTTPSPDLPAPSHSSLNSPPPPPSLAPALPDTTQPCPCASRRYSGRAILILASDGVWDAIPPERTCALIAKCSSVSAAAKGLVSAAIKARGLRDDTTCLVVASPHCFRRPPPRLSMRKLPQSRARSFLVSVARWCRRSHSRVLPTPTELSTKVA